MLGKKHNYCLQTKPIGIAFTSKKKKKKTAPIFLNNEVTFSFIFPTLERENIVDLTFFIIIPKVEDK